MALFGTGILMWLGDHQEWRVDDSSAEAGGGLSHNSKLCRQQIG